jgi:hypothetical protein
MTFANPAGPAARQGAAAYVKALVDLLGARDPPEVLARQDVAVRGALAGVSEAALRQPEAPGKWSLLQVVRHLVDTEVVYGYRVRLVVAEDHPRIPAYDQDRWATLLHYLEGSAADALDELACLRRMNLRFYRSLDEREVKRAGLHEERGEESVEKIVRMLAAHDLVHRRQLQRIRGALGLPPTEAP